jgi:hypothetical protein
MVVQSTSANNPYGISSQGPNLSFDEWSRQQGYFQQPGIAGYLNNKGQGGIGAYQLQDKYKNDYLNPIDAQKQADINNAQGQPWQSNPYNPTQYSQGDVLSFYKNNPEYEKTMQQIGMSQQIGQQQSSELYGNKADLAGRYQDVLQRRAQALEQGASPAEVASMRAEGQQQGQNLMAQQGRAGISGGVAMAQQQNVQNKTADRVATANTMAREKALADYSGDVGARLYGVESGGLNTANMLQRQLAAQKAGTQINMAY